MLIIIKNIDNEINSLKDSNSELKKIGRAHV